MNLVKINPSKETKRIVSFIRKTLKKQGFKKLVLGLSGGVDSSTCAFLATKAIGPENLYILLAPYQNQDMTLGKKVIKKLQIPQKNVFQVDTTLAVNAVLKKTSQKFSKLQILTGNIIARVRMIITFDLAKRLNTLVCGTENRSEYLLGYFTRFGDEASDIEPIRHLYKTQVYQLAKYLAVPQEIIKAEPTAGLWPDQTDEKELGFSYKQADPILYLLFDKHLAENGIAKFPSTIRYGAGISRHRRLKSANPEIIKKVLRRVENNLFKYQVPYHLSSSTSSSI